MEISDSNKISLIKRNESIYKNQTEKPNDIKSTKV